MSDLKKYILKRKSIDDEFLENFEEGYQEFKISGMRTVSEIGMRFTLNFVYSSAKLCQNIRSDYWIRGGFTQFILRSRGTAIKLRTKNIFF